MSYSDIEHLATIISGCESLTNGNPESPNAIYALTVLKLHASDAGYVAGQEGFMDHVRKGAKKTKEWLEKFIKALKEFISTVWTKVVAKAKRVFGPSNKEIAADAAKVSFGALKTIVTELDGIANGNYSDTLEKFGLKKGIQDMSDLADQADKMLDGNHVDIESFWTKVNKLLLDLKNTSEKLVAEWKKAEAKVPKDLSDPEYSELHNESEDLGWSSVSVGQCLNHLTKAIDRWSTKIDSTVAGEKKDDE